MGIVQTFGNWVAKETEKNPERARKLLILGYNAQELKLSVAPNKNLPKCRQYVSAACMKVVLNGLSHPEQAVAMSLFTPTEPLQAAGLYPYSVETISAYITGTKCEQAFLEHARQAGVADTECSYHRVFMGTLESGLVPLPKLEVYTNLACDGNLITFPHIHEKYGVPAFLIDVPYEKSEDAVADVARQLREMAVFVEDTAGRAVDEDELREYMVREKKAGELTRHALFSGAHKRLPADMSTEMFPALINHVVPGSEACLRYAELLDEDMAAAPESDGIRLVWMHLIPNMQPAVNKVMSFTDRVHFTYVDVANDTFLQPIDPDKPYESMARRMVYSPYNGPVAGRVQQALDAAEATDADGVVLFTQWGCKGTIGAAPLIKKRIEAAGYPCLILDGDGCDQTNASDGQTATRLNAFLEMLEARRELEEAEEELAEAETEVAEAAEAEAAEATDAVARQPAAEAATARAQAEGGSDA